MEVTPIGASKITRLRAVQARVRTLARNHSWFGDAIRAAFLGQLALRERYRHESSVMDDRERLLARELLIEGRLLDPGASANSPCLIVEVKGLCPIALAEQLGRYGTSNTMPRELESEGAAAALAALDRDTLYHDRDLPKKKWETMVAEDRAARAAKTHVSFSWMIVVSQPDDWQQPADPQSLARADLERFSNADYLTIALFWLGGLADVGARRPLVPKPKGTGDKVRDVAAYAAWRARFPINDAQWEQDRPPLSVRKLHPDVAEQLLDFIETWAEREAAKRGEKLPHGGAIMSPLRVDGHGSGVAAAEPDAIEPTTKDAKHEGARGATHTPDGAEGPRTPPKGHDDKHKWQRPVRISEAAVPAGKRCDLLLKMLRTRMYPIGGTKGAYIAELAHIIATVPRKRKVLTAWADASYPVD